MSAQAPIYVRAYDLAKWVLARTARFPKQQRFVLARRLEEAVLDLTDEVVVALATRDGRVERLRRADAACARLRVALRLAGDLGYLSDRQARFAHAEVDAIGRMLGGWIRQASRLHSPDEADSVPPAEGPR